MHAQGMLLTGCRLDELASAEDSWIDAEEGLIVVPADSYKSDHVHVVPLVPQAVKLLKIVLDALKGSLSSQAQMGEFR